MTFPSLSIGFLATIIAFQTMISPRSAIAAAPPDRCYLFSSFRDNGQDGLHLSWSPDGYHFTALNNDRSYLKPEVGKEKLMRDPCILRGPDGIFRMVWTNSWTDRSIGYASSKDLIHWSPQQAIPVMKDEPTARNCWAPEVVYDDIAKQYLIYWATTIPGQFPATDHLAEEDYNHRIYCTTTKDFESFTPTKLFYDTGFNVIDATMFRDNNKILLVVKDETKIPVKKHLRIATAKSFTGPFTELSPAFTPSWVEGPTIMKVGDDTIVYFDCYTAHHYGAMRSKDLIHWEDITNQIHFPKGSRHGTILEVPGKFIQSLLQAGEPAEKQSEPHDPAK